jgi:hypothetical protein
MISSCKCLSLSAQSFALKYANLISLPIIIYKRNELLCISFKLSHTMRKEISWHGSVIDVAMDWMTEE